MKNVNYIAIAAGFITAMVWFALWFFLRGHS
jgi:hypothetical protein